MDPNMDPRVLLAMTLIGLGYATVEKLREIWKNHGATDADLDAILSEVEQRLARRSDAPADPTQPQ